MRPEAPGNASSGELPPTLRAFAEDAGGPIEEVEFIRAGDTGGRVWRIAFEGGAPAYLKASTDRRKARQEIEAYASWLRAPGVVERTPALIAAREGPEPALLITALPGRPMDRVPLSADEEREAFRQAGAFLRALHSLEYEDRDPISLEEAVQERMAAWRDRAAGVVDRARLEALERRFAAGPAIRGPRVPCHRDFRPRNWLVDRPEPGVVRLFVIDFEHARADTPLADFVRLEADVWREHPSRRDAFFRGYGRILDAADVDRLRRLVALDATGTLAWHGNRWARPR